MPPEGANRCCGASTTGLPPGGSIHVRDRRGLRSVDMATPHPVEAPLTEPAMATKVGSIRAASSPRALSARTAALPARSTRRRDAGSVPSHSHG